MSGAQTSTFGDPNILYKTLSGAGYQEVEANRLLNQGRERGLAADDIEMIGRGAGSLLQLPDEASRAAQYPAVVAQLQQYGVKAGLPATYPGEAALRRALAMGTPSADLFKQGLDRTAKGAIAPGDGGTAAGTGTGTGGGGGAGTAGGGTAGDGLTGDKARDLPLIAQRESGGNPTVLNYVAQQDPTAYGRGATASGKYQIVNSTWREGMQLAGLDPAQYATARDAPEAVQDRVASAIYDKYGAAPWRKGPRDWVKDEQGRYQMATVRPAAGAPGGAPSVTAPGGSTAPAVVTGDVGRPGDVPPPPWGAPGAYRGGGMGPVIGGQPAAARATIPAGRPTGPPVITDQPASSNVVAGPPGTAVVGAPQPPGPAVPGNVAAINAGIVRAGGTAATDPNLTPTPARYAGTAPAPSVEALPETGWGSQVGSGYGPQNTLAPAPVPSAPARPAAPAPAATATQPPAADTLPPLPTPTPPEPRNNNGLTAAQQRDVNIRRNDPTVSADELRKRVDAYSAANDAKAEKYQADQLAYANAVQSRQAAVRQEQAAADTAEKAARERQKAADPIQGTDDKSNADRTLFKLVDKMNAGTATPEERRLYAQAAQYYLKPQMQWISDPNEPTKSIMVPVAGQLPYGFPHPSFQPGQPSTETKPPAPTKTDFKPLPDSERKLLVDTSTRLDQLAEQRSTFKPDFGGFGSAALGEAANLAARNLPASPTAVARADWWQNYQRMKLAVRQGISGQSLTASELAEFDKADINPGMSADRIAANLAHQDRVLRTSHERRVRSLAADRYSPDAIREAGGIDPTTAAEHPAGVSAPTPPASPPPPGFKVIVP